MTSLTVLAFAFLSTVQSGEPEPQWQEVRLTDSERPLRYLLVRNEGPENAQARPVVVLAASEGDAALESAARAVALAAGPSALVVVPADPASVTLTMAAALRLESREHPNTVWRNPVLVAEGARARQALGLLESAPELRAAAILLDPPELDAADLERAGALVDVPFALVRGREDDNAASLALLERRTTEGAPTGLDFASTCQHATLDCNEGYLARRLKEFLAAAERRSGAEDAARNVLERFHGAAAKADGPAYFACLAPDAIFIGTDASERWTVPQFRAFCEPYFSKGKGWTYTASERHVYLAPDLRTAWFDERLDSQSYGNVRGSGVLRLDGERWRITQYVLSIPVPNELAKDLVQRIRERR